MDQFVIAIRTSLENKNWYAALFTTLALPDICGKIENPDQYSSTRYATWFDEYILEQYTVYSGPRREKKYFLTGKDCYALRCAYLHEGVSDITKQKAREALKNFKFVKPRQGSIIHNNLLGSSLQLQIDIFCNDICSGIEKWLSKTSKDELIQKRLQETLQILSFNEI